VRKPVDTVKKVVRKVNQYAQRMYESTKRDHNKVKNQLNHWKNEVSKAQNILNMLWKKSRKIVKLLEYTQRHGIGRVLTIQKIQFSGTLSSTSTGDFRSWITALILGERKVIKDIIINVHNLKKVGLHLFDLAISRF